MLLKYTAIDFREPIKFNTKHKSLFYQTSIEFLPFIKDKTVLETKPIEEILTPIAHFKFKVLGVEQSIFHSFFFMSGQLLSIMEKDKFIGINGITELIVKEIKFTDRIDLYLEKEKLKELSRSQLQLF